MIEEIPLLTLSREAAKKSFFYGRALNYFDRHRGQNHDIIPCFNTIFFFFIQVFKGVYTVYFPKTLYFCRFPPFSKMIFSPQVQ